MTDGTTLGCQQLSLGVQLRDEHTLYNFYPGQNMAILAQLFACAKGEGPSCMYLWGGAGVGKSHLLQGLCQEASALGHRSLYLPLSHMLDRDPDIVFAGMEHMAVVAWDDVDAVAGDRRFEKALLDSYNRFQAQPGVALVMAATTSWHALPFVLEDVRSRLAWGLAFKMAGVGVEELSAALRHCAKRRGLELGDGVCDFLMRRFPRDLGHLSQVLQRLDEAALSHKRRITIPFIKSLLNI